MSPSKNPTGGNVFIAEECLTREEILRARAADVDLTRRAVPKDEPLPPITED